MLLLTRNEVIDALNEIIVVPATRTIRGLETEIEMSASDIFSNLQFGAMGFLVARKGDWGVGADVIWMALGTTVAETNIDFNQGAFAFYGLRRLGRPPT